MLLVVDQIESYCGREIEVVRDASVASAQAYRSVDSDGHLGPILIKHREATVDASLLCHEIIHHKYRLVDGTAKTAWLVPAPPTVPPGAPAQVFELDWWIQHLFLTCELRRFGISERPTRTIPIGALSTLGHFPAGMWRNLVAFGAWAYVCFCFPELRSFAAARLIEYGLFQEAVRFQHRVSPCFTHPDPPFDTQLRATALIVAGAGAPLDAVEYLRMCRGEHGWYGQAGKLSDAFQGESL
jgi:hypothetical protein